MAKNQNYDYFKSFSYYEDELLHKYERNKLFANIAQFSDEEFMNVLTQYGEGISANFVKFLETALRQINNKKAQQAIVAILRDEIPRSGPTHQQMRTQSLARIGIEPTQLVKTTLTQQTQKTINNYFDVICNHEYRDRDLALTTFVRVV